MSRLEKLSISGIRSFNPKESGVIIFNTPLTLIVGENGTGKTTIIESLKYATTGNFPPNTKGGAFLYDPAIAGQIDTKAEIKLRFINNSDKHISCCRILQVFQRGGKQVQKTLETNLYQETGGDGAFLISTKLTEIDQLIPEHLGVSQPLLDSVIFCHQEESTWPIGEPRVLKEKLDLIFDSAKYIKAHKSLKDTKKTIGSDIK
ncbi:DNA repair protein RAD50, partial [Pancytospora epiphaga]